MRDAFIRGFVRGIEKRAAEFDLPPGEKPRSAPSPETPGLGFGRRRALASGERGFRRRQQIAGAKMALSRGAEKVKEAVKSKAKAYGGALSTGYKTVKWGVPLTIGAAGLSALSAMSGPNKEAT